MTACSIRCALGLFILMLVAGCSSTLQQQDISNSVSQTNGHQKSEGVYFVRPGDTLSAIGRRFGVSSSQLQYRNGIADPLTLKIGTRLVVPHKSQQVPDSFAGRARFIWPLQELDVSSEFGSRNNRHKGADLRAPRGTTIRASADGVVHFVGRQNGYGKVVILKHADNIQTFYAHNDKNLVKKGQQVKQGEKIATVGRTGNATGNHVHFEFIRGRQRLNPRDYLSM
jgi:lipoprotein NlpD